MKKYSIAIIGGSTGALTTALYLLNNVNNINNIVIFDKNEYNQQDGINLPGRDIALNQQTIDTFYKIKNKAGISFLNFIVKDLTPIKEILVVQQNSDTYLTLDSYKEKLAQFGAVITLHKLNSALLNFLSEYSQVEIKYNTEVCDINKHLDYSILYFKENNSQLSCIEAELVVVAANVKLKNLVNKLDVFNHNQHAIISNVTTNVIWDNTAIEFFTTNGPVALLPNGNNRFSLVVCSNPNKISYYKKSSSELINYLNLLFSRVKLKGKILQITSINDLSSYPVSRCNINKLYENGVVYVGNAAHTLHPVSGQGYNLIVRSIIRLANVINENKQYKLNSFNVLVNYSDRHFTDMIRMIKYTDFLAQSFVSQNELIKGLRKIILLHLDNYESLRRFLILYFLGKLL